MRISLDPARGVRAAAARHILTAVLAVAALSSCSGGKKDGPTKITEPAPSTLALTVAGSGSGSGRVRSTPVGIDCTVSSGAATGACSARYAPGTVVTLQTEPNATSVFLTYSGDCALDWCQTTMEAPRTVTATFVPNVLAIIPNAASVGGGRITSDPAGIDCVLNNTAPGVGACSASFPLNTVVTLTQEPVAGAIFVGWSTNCTGNPCAVTMAGQRTVDLTFRVPAPPGTLTISGYGTGNGTVTSVPSGIACTITAGAANGTCSAVFAAGIAVALTPAPTDSSTFNGFAGACAGSTCSVQIATAATMSVSAGFTAAVVTPPTPTPTPTPPPPPPPSPTLSVMPSPASRGGGTLTSSPAGINCTVLDGIATGVCNVAFPSGTIVSVTQIPAAASIFQAWSGDCVGNPCQVAMASLPRVAEVTYRIPPPGIVTVSGNGTGSGNVTSSPSGISCTITAGVTTGVCSATFDAGTGVTLIGGSTNNGSFDGFSGACTGGACAVTVSSALTSNVTATFSAAPQRLTVAAGSGSAGGGVITSSPSGINCVLSGSTTSGTCTAFFAYNTVVTLQQTTSGNAVFSAWGADCAADPCQLTLTQGRTAYAVFQTQTVTVAGGGSGTGTVTSSPAGISCTITNGVTAGTCQTTFPPNTVVTLNGTPAGLSSFSGYSGGCTGATCTIALVAGQIANVTAQFAAPPTLTFSSGTGSQGGGTLVSTPTGLSCTLSYAATSGTCSNPFLLNTTLTVTQTPTDGSVFVNWAGACTGTGACQVALTQSRAVQAVYRLAVPGSLTILSGAGTGSGSVSSSPGGVACSITNTVKSGICRAIFPVGSSVTLIPIANGGSTFTGFTGSCTGMTCTLTVPENGDLTVTANFTP